MNNVLVFRSAQISLPKAWELARRQTGPLLCLDLCLFSWFSISRGYQLNLYYIPQAVSVCVTHTKNLFDWNKALEEQPAVGRLDNRLLTQ